MRVLTIGRSGENDIVINDSQVSRHHLQLIQHDDGHFTLFDFGSTNGTYVNGKRISGEVDIMHGDIVRIGNTTLPWNSYFAESGQKQKRPHPLTGNSVAQSALGDANGYSVLTFVLGLAAFIMVAYIIIHFLSSGGRLIAQWAGTKTMLYYFPAYLHGDGLINKGQWWLIILSLILGVVADVVDDLLDPSEDENKLSNIGKWLANVSVTISGLFLILAIIAPYIYK